MNEFGLYLSEQEFKIIRIFMNMAGLEDIQYHELDNATLYTVLNTLEATVTRPTAKKMLQNEIEGMQTWYQEQLFYNELENILSKDDV